MDPRQLQMLLMMAQSQPMFLAMMGMEGKLRAELDRREKLAEIQVSASAGCKGFTSLPAPDANDLVSARPGVNYLVPVDHG